MQQRLRQHNAGTASRYTRGRTPVVILARTPTCFSKSAALKLERTLKKSPRHKKPGMLAALSKAYAMHTCVWECV
jgi:putative endonuclease